MERIRVAGIIPMEDGFAFMHRKDVKKRKDFQEYYTFPGGGVEEGETPEEGILREVKEELGIEVGIVKKLYEMNSEKFKQKEIFFLCDYLGGEFGTGDGPEFNCDPKYIDSGKYLPEIIKREEVENLLLLPFEIKEKFVEDIKRGKI
ncbi:MAG: NUDIX domain-containing protein [Clostridia bacterium]|nr:NUDIX domain-containing protein [Clostridia bacterium]